MNHQSLWHAFVLLIFAIFSSSSKFIHAKNLELNSTANISTSWINNSSNSVIVNSTQLRITSLSPILYRGSSNGSQYMCAFCCLTLNDSAIADCLFGVLIFKSSFRNENKFLINDPKLVWSANRDRPVKMNATLIFNEYGDLNLKDSDGTFVWSTNTSDKEIKGLALTETGNLLLHGNNKKIVWQSFDHPTDTLLPSQKLTSGQSLWSSKSETDLRTGLFSVLYKDYTLLGNVQSNPPTNYFYSDIYSAEKYFNMDNNTLSYKEPLASTTARFTRLDPDGHLNVYEWGVSDWNVAADLFAKDIGECGYPLVCGKYGICSSGQQCSCPDDANNQNSSFRPVTSRQPNLGCTPATPISCSNSKSHSLLQLKNTSYLNLNDRYGFSNPSKENITLEDCKDNCLRNCSCKAAFFIYNIDIYYSSYYFNVCLLVSEVYSMKYTDRYSDILVFLKVEESPDILVNSSTKRSPRKSSSPKRIIVGSCIGAFLGVVFLFATFLLLRRKNEIGEFDEYSFNQVPWMPTRFSYEDLKSITNNFVTKLGQGGFGSVFEGTLNDGTKVAVKRLDGLRQIKNSFLAEVESIGSIHHVNLVRLIGFCAEKSHGLLVYEYMPKGSLDKWIFQTNRELSLEWKPRKNIILDIAKGLAYLHEDCRCKILHLDIKPHNILLDENLNAKVSDFGLAKLIDKDQSKVMTTLKGTPGYLAPEWLSSIITEKVDVYSFGVVVLEILCGRKNVDLSLREEDMHLLAIFKKKTEEGRLDDMVDTSNEDMQSHVGEILKMMKIAKWCLQDDYSLRPLMSTVVKAIEDSADVEDILAYNFTEISISTTCRNNIIGDATMLPPTLLSGPR